MLQANHSVGYILKAAKAKTGEVWEDVYENEWVVNVNSRRGEIELHHCSTEAIIDSATSEVIHLPGLRRKEKNEDRADERAG